MPGLRRLRDPRGRPGLLPRARHPARAGRVRHGHRLRGPLRVLHGHVRDARHPRPRARAGDRPGGRAAGPLDLGRDRRRRRAVDRRQPPDPRAAPQRAGEDPAVQQPDLRAHQGPGVADVRARQGDEVDAVRLASTTRSTRSSLALGAEATFVARTIDTDKQHLPRCCARPPRTRARRSSRSTRTARCSTTARSTRCATRGQSARQPDPRSSTASRSASASRARTASCAAPTADSSSSTWPPSARTRCWCTTRIAHEPSLAFELARLAARPNGPTPIGIFRAVERPVYGAELSASLDQARRRSGRPSSKRCCTPGIPGPFRSRRGSGPGQLLQ